MTHCLTPPVGSPVITLTLVGAGEPMMRMEKRLSCAARGLGVRLKMETSKEAEAFGIAYAQTPAVLHDGKVILNGLPRTEEIEALLRSLV